MGSCKIMMEVEDIIQDINRSYQISIDPNYTERIKRLSCGHLCGVCQRRYIVESKEGGVHNV